MKHSVIGLIAILMVFTSYSVGSDDLAEESIIRMSKIQKIFRKKLQRKCGFTITHFAEQHTAEEWREYSTGLQFLKEFTRICPRGAISLKAEWISPLQEFSTHYGKGSGNKPEC